MTVTRLQQRRGTAAEWLAGDPNQDAIILASGEFGLETDTNKFKIGNGASTWQQLDYQSLNNLVVDSSSPLTLNTNSVSKIKTLSLVVGNSGVQAYNTSINNISLLTSTTPGLLKKTGANSWVIDYTAYATSDTNYYPTAVTINGTASAPTIGLTMNTGTVTTATIPVANSTTTAGIVSTGTQTFGGTKTLIAPVIDSISASAATGINPSLYSNTTSGTISVGSGITTGIVNIGGSSATSAGTVNILTATTTSGTKSINIGTNGNTGSTTTINIGTATGTTPTINLLGTVKIGTTTLNTNATAGTIVIPSSGTLVTNITTTIGDLVYTSATGTPGTLSRLAGNIATQPSFLTSYGNATSNTSTVFTSSTGTFTAGTTKVVLDTSPIISGLTLLNTPTLASSAPAYTTTNLPTAITLDASAAEMFAINGGTVTLSSTTTFNIQNLAAGKKIVIAIRNTNVAYTASFNASATTAAGVAVFLQPTTPGAASVTSLTMAATTGTALITVMNIGGVFYGSV